MAWLDLSLEPQEWGHRLAALGGGMPIDALGRRWQRALSRGAPLEESAQHCVLSSAALTEHRDRLIMASRTLDELLAPTFSSLAKRDFTLLLADCDGVVVERRAGGGFAEVADALHLIPGAVWDESTRGTNAIGTALAEERPVAVLGAAHLSRPNHGLVCYAAPIFDAWGEMWGVLDATSMVARQDPLVAGAVFAAARTIEESAWGKAFHEVDGGVVQRLLGRLGEPGLIVSPRGMITHANLPAVRTYGFDPGARPVDGVVKVRRPLASVVAVDIDELKAAGRGQLRLPGFTVEVVAGSAGRPLAYVLLQRPTVRSPISVPETDTFADLVGSDPALTAVRSHARKVATSTLPVLILGETGTGKDLLARGVHASSPRHDKPLVAVNCSGITPSLLHAELFGYVGGAFTGADPGGREGRLAMADGGTLFLDEVGDMPAELQSTLLRFLEDGTYRRVGEASVRRSDVRLVCATSRDLPEMVAEGTFRKDLYYRIRGVVLNTPTLRQRSDIALICRALVERLVEELEMGRAPFLSEAALAEVSARSWPGNVRQLRMALHHALVVSDGARTLEAWHLPPREDATTPVPMPTNTKGLVETQVDAVRRALADANGSVSAAARRLGVARSTVYRILKRHGED